MALISFNGMITRPLVSVIICFFNEEAFLEEAIISVLQQNYQEWELLLIDDGSTDESTDIAKKYTYENFNKITYFDHKEHANKGLSASRNLGISKSKGELIAFLDADDVWTAEKLQAQVNLMTVNKNAGMLCEASIYWYSWSNKDKEDVTKQVGEVRDKLIEPPQLIEMLYPLADGNAPCPSGIMIRRSVLSSIGGFESHFSGIFQLYEDQAFLFKIYLQEAVYISSDCNNKYRQRAGSIVNKVIKEGNYHAVRKYFLTWAQQYMSDTGIQNYKVKKLLKQALFPYHHPLLHFLLVKIPIKGKLFLKKVTRK